MINMQNSSVQHQSERYRWLYSAIDGSAEAISKKHNLPLPLAEVLIKRGYSNDADIEEYFTTPLSSLINPFNMKGMAAAVERISKALKEKQSICIYGDYDVDGITSTALLYLFLQELGANVQPYIPNRLDEGYDLNIDAVKELAEKRVNLIITVDCGISAVNAVNVANELGIDVVVTDHHQQAGELPNAIAVVNPMQEGDTYAFKSLAGVGVAFKLCIALRHALRQDSSWTAELPNLKKYMDIVSLGTIADVVPLCGENRVFVVYGLRLLSEDNNTRPGLDELKRVAGVPKTRLSTSHVGFVLAPRINAVGRLGDSSRGFNLITTPDKLRARRLAAELDQENKFRQDIEKEILSEVFDMIESKNLQKTRHGFVLYAKDWHPGVLGIVASRVADKYYKPTIILTEENGIFKGSARSIPGFHLYDGLKELSHLLISFGGHKYAAGVKVSHENIAFFAEEFDRIIAERITEGDHIPEINIDAYIEPEDVDNKFIHALDKFAPYGSGNKEPVFCMRGVEQYQAFSLVGKTGTHLKCVFIKNNILFDSIGYDLGVYSNLLESHNKFDIIFTISYNGAGYRAIQLVLKDLKASE